MIISLTNYDNIKFNAVLEDNLVAIYDAQFRFTEHGQFITRYFQKTILEMTNSGLNLDGGVPEWYLTAGNILDLQNFILNNTKGE